MSQQPERVVVLGGGMAGLAAAWRLSDPAFAGQIESITVYQRGWRLGGKGASSRGVHGRIEEHGLHVWLGYYENAFCLLQEVYEFLDRTETAPDCPIQTWTDALKPSTEVGLADLRGSEWHHWVGEFAQNDLTPGDGVSTEPLTPASFVQRALGLLRDFFVSRNVPEPTEGQPVSAGAGWTALRSALGAVLELTRLGWDISGALPAGPIRSMVQDALASAQHALLDVVHEDDDVRQTWELASVVVASIRGIIAHSENGELPDFRALNAWDYREWIQMHGASEEAADSTLVRGLYDLVFGYQDGDTTQPGFGAGLGLFLSGKTFFDYKGAIFWKMQAGMGEIVFAPLYEALSRRGVQFEFFHQLENIGLTEDDRAVVQLDFATQAELAEGVERYEPLISVGGLPVFPAAPDATQLKGAASTLTDSWWSSDVGRRELRRGRDFDTAVFAIPIGMARLVTSDLIAASQRWQQMVDGLGVVSTQALQIWMNASEQELGWHRPGVTMSGFVKPFDTWASMPQLIATEQWPAEFGLESIEYFCATMPTAAGPLSVEEAEAAHEAVRRSSIEFLNNDVGHYLPGAVTPEGFRWQLLCGASDATSAALASQYWRANVDPSDLYIQSLPGTDRLRLCADESGFDGLVLAGDWTDNGVNAGCIEAASLSGLQAANAVLGRPLLDHCVGTYLPLRRSAALD